jgi:chromosomal replication initiator protein
MRVAPSSYYGFANFVAGPGTEAALAAAMAAARQPGAGGRLLVISGGVGLGKTHLARAIVNEARTLRPRGRAAYCTAEELIGHLIDPWRRRRPIAVLRRRDPLDVLVVDDLHLLSPRPGTRDVCGRLLTEVGTRCRQIVLSGADAPGDLEASCARPHETTAVQVGPPDLDTRVRMLERWAHRDRIGLPPDVVRFVAEAFVRNVRELQGALLRLGAHACFQRQKITL